MRFEDLAYEKYKARGFQTPSGKMEIYSQRLKDAGQPPVPVFGGDVLNPISFYNDRANFPVVGISGPREPGTLPILSLKTFHPS